MLYLFFGEDNFRSRERLHEFLEQLSDSKDRMFSLSWLDADTFAKPSFEELVREESLFGGHYIIVCENLFQEEDFSDFLVKNLELCACSKKIFVFCEDEVEPSHLRNFQKFAAKIEEFSFLPPSQLRVWLEKEAKEKKVEMTSGLREELIQQCGNNLWLLSQEIEKYALNSEKGFLGKKKEVEKVNIFHLTDAIAAKDRSRAWFLFQKAMLSGADIEEIFWKIVWQVKNLLMIKKLQFASPTGGPLSEKKITEKTHLHPYVVKKTVSSIRLYTEEELARYSSELINLYNNARRGRTDFETGIEKFLIKL